MSILRISDMAEHMYINNLNQRIGSPSRDAAVCQLVDTINAMFTRLEKDVQKQTFFISDASHEMRTPIAVIKGYTDLIDRWGKNNPRIMQESIDAIKAETNRINALVLSLLTLARGDEVGKDRPADPVSLNDTCADAIKESAVIRKNQKVKLIEHSHEVIMGDYEMILQLIRLFMDNASKYAKENHDELHMIVSGDANGSHLSVKDFGIGISDEDLPYIFERFYRADKSRNSRIPGFGLGLPMAEMIARAHNAAICVHSEVNVGTEFTVTFPKISEEETSALYER
jgi:signal transduction histidine kinase